MIHRKGAKEKKGRKGFVISFLCELSFPLRPLRQTLLKTSDPGPEAWTRT